MYQGQQLDFPQGKLVELAYTIVYSVYSFLLTTIWYQIQDLQQSEAWIAQARVIFLISSLSARFDQIRHWALEVKSAVSTFRRFKTLPRHAALNFPSPSIFWSRSNSFLGAAFRVAWRDSKGFKIQHSEFCHPKPSANAFDKYHLPTSCLWTKLRSWKPEIVWQIVQVRLLMSNWNNCLIGKLTSRVDFGNVF